MTHCVDATVQAMQPSRANPPRDAALVDPHHAQLPYRNHPMLPRRDPRDLEFELGAFLSHVRN